MNWDINIWSWIKKNPSVLLIPFLFVLIFFWGPIVHSKVETTCGKYIGEDEVKGVEDFVFEYSTKKGKKYRIGISKKQIKLSADELKELECIEMEYSAYLNFSGTVTDKRVRNK
ncbi:MAG: hypothetical protein M9916_07370 [Crocinitomicaceae bacterium]|nr:hypothetical protein [Crocinitomicaceae bacterium]